MIVDLCCALIIGLLSFLGYRRGLILTALKMGGLLLAYVGAFFLYRPMGRLMGMLTSLQPLLADALGGFLVFNVVLALFALAAFLVKRSRKRLEKQENAAEKTLPGGGKPGRIGGALLGGLYGSGLAVLLVWALLLLQSIGAFQTPEVARTVSGAAAKPLIEWFAYALVHQACQNDTAARAASRVASEPRKAVSDLNAVVNDPRFQSLFGDVRLLEVLANHPDKAQSHPAMQQLARDPGFVERAAFLGLVDRDQKAPLPPEQALGQMANRLAPMARTVRTLAEDPEIQQLVSDPALKLKLESQDLFGLANDPKMNRLATRVLQTLKAESDRPTPSAAPPKSGKANTEPDAEAASPAPRPAAKTPIFKWVDKQGVTHFSQHPPDRR